MAYVVSTHRSSKPRSGLALGGLGAGWFEIRQDGTFRNWNIFNNKPLFYGPLYPHTDHSVLFFVIRYQVKGEEPRLKLLQIEESHNSGSINRHEFQYIFPWISGVETIDFWAQFPFARLTFRDPQMPFEIDLETFSPFIPHDLENSSLPTAIFNFTVRPKTSKPVDILLMACLRNGAGYDVEDKTYTSRPINGRGWQGFEMSTAGLPERHPSDGTLSLASLHPRSTYYLGWEHIHPYYEIVLRQPQLPNIDDTAGRNSTDKKTGRLRAMDRCWSTVGMHHRLEGRKQAWRHRFVMGWHFPHLPAFKPKDDYTLPTEPAGHYEGHYYDNFHSCAAEVVSYVAKNCNRLQEATRAFHDAFYAATVEPFILDQVNSQLNTFFTSSWFSKEGHFGIVEGNAPDQTYAGLATTDVAMYGGVSYASLFPQLDRDTNRVYRSLQGTNGKVIHSIPKNFRQVPKREYDTPRLDMPAQFAYMALRAFFWSRDRAYLTEIWPGVKAALDYVLRERDPNGDLLPDMQGVMCSYDNFPMHGVASYVAGQFLAAVGAAVEAAVILEDGEAEARYREVFEKGRATFEESLWNGHYYRLCRDQSASGDIVDEGCLTDQLIGQWAAHLTGLGHIFDPSRIRQALRTILKMNYRADQGLRNCQWPGDEFLHEVTKDTWVDQANTCWTGVELGFASFLLYEGLYKEAREVIHNVDSRHRHWGIYWDHQEFGGHYFRPMSGWAIVHGLLGLSIRDGHYRFAPAVPGHKLTLLLPHAAGYAHFHRQLGKRQETDAIEALAGPLTLSGLSIQTGLKKATRLRVILNGSPVDPERYATALSGRTVTVCFSKDLTIKPGQTLEVVIVP